MRVKQTKESLTQEFLTLKNSYETPALVALLGKLNTFLKKRPDIDVENMCAVLKYWLAYAKGQPWAVCREIVRPIFKHLESMETWSFLDVCVLTPAVAHAPTFEQAVDFTDRALSMLDTHYTDEKSYWNVRGSVQYNVISRIVQAKYFNNGVEEPEASLEETQKAMDKYAPYVLSNCREYKLKVLEYFLCMRMAIFDRDYYEAARYLQKIKKLDVEYAKVLYSMALREVLAYHYLLGETVTEEQLRVIIGLHFRLLRDERGLSRDEVAAALVMTVDHLSGVERGDRGASHTDIYRAAHYFNVDVNYFYYGARPESTVIAANDKVEEMTALLNDFELDEVTALLDMCKTVKASKDRAVAKAKG